MVAALSRCRLTRTAILVQTNLISQQKNPLAPIMRGDFHCYYNQFIAEAQPEFHLVADSLPDSGLQQEFHSHSEERCGDPPQVDQE